ncbi:MAG: FAD-dependent oxidoreductase [Ilumatobacteraceae bacterium]
MSARTLNAALADFERIVGADSVIAADDELRSFRDPFQPASWDVYTASAVVSPTTVEEVQAIVRVANERKISLWTHGQGKNNGYGGPAPRSDGSVIVSLRKRNRVLEINEELGYAVVEPGVRWFDLYEAIQSGGHKLWLSCADLGWGSVIGNSLDNGVTYLTGPISRRPSVSRSCSRTARSSGPGWVRCRGTSPGTCTSVGLGPVLDPLFMQSNFGIVTRMGLWLLPEPQCYMPLWIRAWKDDDLGPLTDTFRELMLDRTIDGVPQIINTLDMAAMITKRKDWYDGPGPIPDSLIDTMAKELEVGRWIMRLALYGDEAVVDHRYARVKGRLRAHPGGRGAGHEARSRHGGESDAAG